MPARGTTRTGKTRWRAQKRMQTEKQYVNMRETVRDLDRDADNREKRGELDGRRDRGIASDRFRGIAAERDRKKQKKTEKTRKKQKKTEKARKR